MDTVPTLLLVVLGGIALIIIARWSREKYEKENANRPMLNRHRKAVIFLLWSVVWAALAYVYPLFLALGITLVFMGFFPLGKRKESLSKTVIDYGFLSAFTVGVSTFIYAHVI